MRGTAQMMSMADEIDTAVDQLDGMGDSEHVRQARQYMTAAATHMRNGDPGAAAGEIRTAHAHMAMEADQQDGDQAQAARDMAEVMQQMMRQTAAMHTSTVMDQKIRAMASRGMGRPG